MAWQLMAMSMPMVEVLDGSFKYWENIIANRENREELRENVTVLNHMNGANKFEIYAESEN